VPKLLRFGAPLSLSSGKQATLFFSQATIDRCLLL
jgi:hypothetical protein